MVIWISLSSSDTEKPATTVGYSRLREIQLRIKGRIASEKQNKKRKRDRKRKRVGARYQQLIVQQNAIQKELIDLGFLSDGSDMEDLLALSVRANIYPPMRW